MSDDLRPPVSPRAAFAATLTRKVPVFAWERAAMWGLLAYCVVAHAQGPEVAPVVGSLVGFVRARFA